MTLNELLGDLEMHPNDDGKLIIDLELEKFNILIGKLHELNNNWNELKKWCKETIENVECTSLSEDYLMGCEDILKKMQELEQGKDENTKN